MFLSKRFQSASPRVRVELSDLSSREMNAKAREGLLDVVVTAYAPAHEMPGFQWTELWRVSTVLVMPKSHPLAKLKKIAPTRLRDLPLIGLAQENYPDYVHTIRAMLEPSGITPRFLALINDGVPTMFPVLEANRAFLQKESLISFRELWWLVRSLLRMAPPASACLRAGARIGSKRIKGERRVKLSVKRRCSPVVLVLISFACCLTMLS